MIYLKERFSKMAKKVDSEKNHLIFKKWEKQFMCFKRFLAALIFRHTPSPSLGAINKSDWMFVWLQIWILLIATEILQQEPMFYLKEKLTKVWVTWSPYTHRTECGETFLNILVWFLRLALSLRMLLYLLHLREIPFYHLIKMYRRVTTTLCNPLFKECLVMIC